MAENSHPHIRVNATAVIAGDPGWSACWVDGFVEIATGRDPGSSSVATGVHLVLDHVAFAALLAALEGAAG